MVRVAVLCLPVRPCSLPDAFDGLRFGACPGCLSAGRPTPDTHGTGVSPESTSVSVM